MKHKKKTVTVHHSLTQTFSLSLKSGKLIGFILIRWYRDIDRGNWQPCKYHGTQKSDDTVDEGMSRECTAQQFTLNSQGYNYRTDSHWMLPEKTR